MNRRSPLNLLYVESLLFDSIRFRSFIADHQIGEHRLDFLIENRIIVEMKAVETLENVHFAIVRSYLKATGLADDLILNFSTMPLTVKRVRRERTFESVDLKQ